MTMTVTKECVILRDGKYFFLRVLHEEAEISSAQLDLDISRLQADASKFDAIKRTLLSVKDADVEVPLEK